MNIKSLATTFLLVAMLLVSAVSAQTIIRVDDDSTAGTPDGSTWGLAYQELSDAMDDALTAGGDYQFWIAEGSYTPTLTGNAPTISDSLIGLQGWELYGGFVGNESTLAGRGGSALKTFIDGDYGASDTQYYYVMGLATSSSTPAGLTVVDSLRFDGGKAVQLAITDNGGHGSTDITVNNCFFEKKIVHNYDSCLSLIGNIGLENVIISRCWFMNNEAERIIYTDEINEGATALLTNNYLYDNTTEYAVITHLGFRDNGSDDDALYVVMNCLIVNNTQSGFSAHDMGVINSWEYSSSDKGETIVSHCTFNGNDGYDAVLAVGPWTSFGSFKDNPVTMSSSICWDNAQTGVPLSVPAIDRDSNHTVVLVELRYSTNDGGMVGVSTTTWVWVNDPLFIGSTWKLGTGSLCIDAADDKWLDAVNGISDLADLDADGNTTEDIPWDMGRQAREVDQAGVIDKGLDDALASHVSDQGCFEVQ